ncbi:MAG: ribose 5-phosphate isomerase B [Limnochordia bacterium]|jgi:ribose 5-phosphate isomerase B
MVRKILIVCTGNTCRSSMAVPLLERLLQRAGRADISVDSAGLAAWPGAPASLQAQRVLAEQGLDLREHRAQRLTPELAAGFDLILTMTRAHKEAVLQLLGGQGVPVYTLGEYAGEDIDVADPFGGDEEVYRACAQQIETLLHRGITNNLLREAQVMKIAIGSDHAGYELKKALLPVMEEWGWDVTDLGTYGTDSVDYPDYGAKVAQGVASGEYDRGILICGTGLGMVICANKVRGVRAVLAHDTFSARMSRMHNDANVLALGARVIGPGLAADIIRIWVETEFEGGRHQKRVDKIHSLEGDGR